MSRAKPELDVLMRAKGYVSVQEASDRTKFGTSTLYSAMDEGKIEGTRVGVRRYILVESLLAYGGDVVRDMWRESEPSGEQPTV